MKKSHKGKKKIIINKLPEKNKALHPIDTHIKLLQNLSKMPNKQT